MKCKALRAEFVSLPLLVREIRAGGNLDCELISLIANNCLKTIYNHIAYGVGHQENAILGSRTWRAAACEMLVWPVRMSL
jgi:hypothetical protein